MKKILILGAGRSSSSLIDYLLRTAVINDYEVTVADASLDLAQQKTNNHPRSRAIFLDTGDEFKTRHEIGQADLVISMLPAYLHAGIAALCVELKKHMVTASYVSPEMKELDEAAKKAGIILMNESGLDPGIDHASAMKIIDHIKEQGGKLTVFKSYTGGLIAPESDDNPWGYKFTWAPRNVILAGQGTARYLENGRYAFIPYHKLFTRTEPINIDDYGDFEGYANRDSLSYRSVYGIEDVQTIIRGTLRKEGYCEAWNALVQLGMTDDTYIIPGSEKLSNKEFLELFLPAEKADTETRLLDYLGHEINNEILYKIEWLGLFNDTVLGVKNASPALMLQTLLEDKWKLKEGDIDMIVMQHQFEYVLQNKTHKLNSSLVVKGDDAVHTAMAKTVGLPVGIITKLILEGNIKLTGVQTPTVKEIYEPLLSELEGLGVKFVEREI
ncbi:MAG TPA: saccharopine dehydrogenase C-terminal domain-containing protein [Bacteroidia bacterium]|nr:saccharopine dehydrogenase C-terminal domain-containing protein [Bacteroidia bacterium]